MDQLFVDLIGKPKLNPSGKLVTLIAENFSLLEDQAKFLKAAFAIPTEKLLPLDGVNKQLIQIGPLHVDIQNQLEKANWSIHQYDHQLAGLAKEQGNKRFHDRLEHDLGQQPNTRSLIYINDASRIQLSLGNRKDWLMFLRLLHKWKSQEQHIIFVFYQQSQPACPDTSLRDLEYISDGCVRTKSFKNCYLQSMWFRPIQVIKTLIPARTETRYYTCKIGRSYWSADLLCFYERHQVAKGHNPDLIDTTTSKGVVEHRKESSCSNEVDSDAIETALNKVGLDDEEFGRDLNAATLPYIKAQNPEQSRIFYYPDKDDDVDEDDPDYDLGI